MKLTDEDHGKEIRELALQYSEHVQLPYELRKTLRLITESEQAWKEEAEKYRQEAMNERELSEKIVGEREELIVENETLRKEAEEAKQVTMEVSAALVESTMQLKQAEEVLRELNEHIEFGKEIPSGEKIWFRDPTGINAVFAKAQDFLSSLGEK